MSKTKVIYFLSAIVLIIGCYALNLSYSLFVETEEKEVVSASVPILEYSLEKNEYEISGNSFQRISVKIKNTGNTSINYGLSVPSKNTNLNIQLVDNENNSITGTIAANSEKEVSFCVTNNSDETLNFTYNLVANYSTLKFDTTTYEDATLSGIDVTNKCPDLYEDERQLPYHILNNKALVENYDSEGNSTGLIKKSEIRAIETVTGIANNASDSGIFMTLDDDGMSYLYRGTVRNNYVDFAGFTWRIVRINGDGTIRLILDGTLDKVCYDENSIVCNVSVFNELNNDAAYVGYMYGLVGATTNTNRCLKLVENIVTDLIGSYTTESACIEAGGTWTTDSYEATHANIKSSTIKQKLDAFYETFLKTDYSGYLGDSTFCGDKSLGSSGSGVGVDNTYFGAYQRLSKNENKVPILKCGMKFSNYKVANNLTYPIALLSADELVLAGAFWKGINDRFYLYNLETVSNWYTLSPSGINAEKVYVFAGTLINSSLYNSGLVTQSGGVRPVINLGSNVLYEGGNGTEGDKYTVKLIPS